MVTTLSDQYSPQGRVTTVIVVSVVVMVFWILDIGWQAAGGRVALTALPHLAPYLGGLAVAISAAWLLAGLLGRGARPDGVVIGTPWRGRALASVVALGGAALMFGAGLFDYVWHAHHPPTPEVLSPPHIVLALGIFAVQLSALLLVVARPQGEGAAEDDRWRSRLLMWPAGMVVLWIATLATEYVGRPNLWHGSEFYQVSALIFPVVLAAVSRLSTDRWPAVKAALVYMSTALVLIWVFPKVPVASGGLASGTSPGHLLPPPFPLLLVVPAFAIDFLHRRHGRDSGPGRDHLLAIGIGLAFLFFLLLVHWFLGDLLLSDLGRTYVFGADRWPYHARLGEWRYQYWTPDAGTRAFVLGLAVAWLLASLSARLGLGLGARGRGRR